MLRREESATTYMGMGIAIPHGTSDAKKCPAPGHREKRTPAGLVFGEKQVYRSGCIAEVGTPI